MLLFKEENARELARFVASIIKNRYLITNGPRTGKYDSVTLEENKAVHREGVKDPVTLGAFIDELSKNNISQKQYSLFDFQFGSKTQDMDLILGAIRGTNLKFGSR